MTGNDQANQPPKVDHERLRKFQEQVAEAASQQPPKVPPRPSTGNAPRTRSTPSMHGMSLHDVVKRNKPTLTPEEHQERLDRIAAEADAREERHRRDWIAGIHEGCRLPSIDQDMTIEDLSGMDRLELQKWRAWLDDRERQPWLYLSGPVGTGKTLLAALALRQLVERLGAYVNYSLPPAHMGLFTKARAMIRSLRPYGAGIEKYLNVNVLVLDDIGTERPTDFSYGALLDVLDERYDNRRTTIITSNLGLWPTTDSPDDHGQLTNTIGDGGRIADRIIEMAEIIEFPPDAPNWRRM